MNYPGPTNGGTRTGNRRKPCFSGNSRRRVFRAYTADTGKRLWTFPTQTGVIAAPFTYSIKGVQYVAIWSVGAASGIFRQVCSSASRG
ncbi:MAG: PQQ-binding-like beta-propeller repeat protein [Sphingomonadales bacterium]|nr:PQQ-binding-like beta-propeller repeat protein [Sphingomonadales bacterium]